LAGESVSVVKRLYEAWERDGFGVVRELMDADIEYVNPPYAVEPGTRRGYDEFEIAAAAIRAAYGERRFLPLELHEVGRRVAVRARVIARGVGSSVVVDTERGYVFDVQDGKVVRLAWFNEPAEAREAAGLEA
jgi:ketosteroid isomerase-like protein